MVEPYKPLYTVREASRVLMMSISDTYALINSGELPYLLLGSKKIRGSDLERFIESYKPEEINHENTTERPR